MKKITTLLIALLVLLALAAPAYAADSIVDYSGHSLFDFEPGSGYTDTDLFDNFKNVMPGDQLSQKIYIQNTADCCDYIKVYLQIVESDPLTYSEPFENEDGKDQANIDGQRDETVATMQDFLHQMDMTVEQDGQTIFAGKADEVMKDAAYLAKLTEGDSTVLTVTLDVPKTMGNDYANRVGEVDFKFLIEEYDYGSSNPKTGDHMQRWLMPAILTMSITAGALLVLLIGWKRRRNQK